MALVARGREIVAAMPQKRRTQLIVCGVVLASACAAVAWWGGRTDWKTLYAGLEGRDLQQVQSELAAANISYEPTPDGLGVMVPAELLDKARMEIAAKGMPQSGRMGFELFDKPNWVGSEFDEKVNYQRALEGELEHTIATIGAVRSARVHLVLPKESLFTSEQQAAKASVVLKLKSTSLAHEQVDSIRNLVAGAVESLTPEQVTLVDADGKVDLSIRGRNMQSGEAEAALEQKLIAMIEPLAGRDNVRATVNITYDESSEEQTDETVDPTRVTPLTTEKRDQISGITPPASGIPGTVSNTQAAAPAGSAVATAQTAKAALPVYPSAGAPQQSTHEESSTFAVTRHTLHQESGPGRIARVTAAVVVNDRQMTEGVGATAHAVWKPRTADEMKRMEELAQAAVGFNTTRGDQVVMQNLSFEANVPPPTVTGMAKATDQAKDFLRSQPELLRTIGAGVLAMLLILMVVRPIAQQAMVLLKEPHALGAGSPKLAALGDGITTSDSPSDSDPSAVEREKARKRLTRKAAAIEDDGIMESVSDHVKREPLESSRLLEAWIGNREMA
jgi:flagellar M-ring protein FliF